MRIKRAFAQRPLSPAVTRAMRDAGLLVIVIVAVARALGWFFPSAPDLRAYWDAGIAAPYAISAEGAAGAYLYSPAFTQLLDLFRGLPFGLVVGVWTAAMLLLLRWMTPRLWPLLAILFINEVTLGNIHILLAAMVVLGFRYPGVWAFDPGAG